MPSDVALRLRERIRVWSHPLTSTLHPLTSTLYSGVLPLECCLLVNGGGGGERQLEAPGALSRCCTP
eukprot:673782-Pyramimonas_sp.AAC.1